MLQTFRDNTQSLLVKVIIGLIIVTFALFGVESLVGLAGQPDAPISVNGTDIGEQQLQNSVDIQRRQILTQMGENADPSLLDDALIRKTVIDGLVEREVLRQSAVENNMAISEALLDQTIVSTAEFQTEGRFDRNRFESVLRNVGMTPLTFRDYLRNEMLLGQDRTGFVASSFVLPGEVSILTGLDRQTRDIYLAELPLGDLTSVDVSDDEITAFYEANQAQYMAEEKLSLNYIELNKQDIASSISIDEAELETQFQQLLSDYQAEEAREAAHILISIDDERSDDDAESLANELANKIANGEDFAALAEEYSDDPGSASEGGDLGLVEKGIMVPEFEDALFSLEEGQVSEPVKTDFGYHLIKLNKIDVQELPSLADVRDQLENEQRLQQAEAELVKLSEELDDLRFSSSDLQEASEIMQLPIKNTGFFGREGGDNPLTMNPRLLQVAFSEEVLKEGENSELIEVDENRIIVVNVDKYEPVRPQSIAEVSAQIKFEIAADKLKQQRMEEAQALMEQVESASSLSGNDPWQVVSNVKRTDTRVSQSVLVKLFRLAVPEEGDVTTAVVDQGDQGVAVIAFTSMNADSTDLTEAQVQNLAAFLSSHKGQLDYQSRVAQLKADAEIELN